MVNRLLEPPLEQVLVAFERNQTAGRAVCLVGLDPDRQVEAMQGVEEEQRSDALVQIVAAATEGVQLSSRGQQLVQRGTAAQNVQRLVAKGRVSGGDDTDQVWHHGGRVTKPGRGVNGGRVELADERILDLGSFGKNECKTMTDQEDKG